MDYESFLRSKRIAAKSVGFEPTHEIDPKLFPFQRDIVRWALRLGRAAIFADCGLGKTFMQLEWAYHVARHTGGKVLILCPLSVARQTEREAKKLGLTVAVCREQKDATAWINITNYEMLKHFDASAFTGVVLDESGILKSYMGKTKREIISAFASTPYKLACTATPAPNDHMELGNHAEFLGVLEANEMLARWFVNDTMEAGAYRLKGHAEKDFWRWIASWAVSLSRPSDLGYPDEGFDLPRLNIIPEVVEVDLSEGSDGMLFRMPELSATSIHKEMRRTAHARAAKVASLVNGSDRTWVVWCNTDYEADALMSCLVPAVEVRGSDSLATKLERLEGFLSGRYKVLVSKPKILGWGMNFQHASDMAFVGLSYSYEAMYQAIRRSWRFGQANPVNVHVVMAETEGPVLQSIQRKQEAHERMKHKMVEAMAENGLGLTEKRMLAPVQTNIEQGENWTMHLGDNCDRIKTLADNSVGLTVSSLPFENLYIYSDIEADMGNSADSEEFFAHMGYLIPELLRVTIPGRLCVMHCKDLPMYRGRDGAAGLRDFPGEIVRAFEKGGWQFHSRVTIWKDPVTEMQRTKNHGLLYKILCQDSCNSRQGMADYLLVFRKWVDGLDTFPDPVKGTDKERFDRYVGVDPPDCEAVIDAVLRNGLPIGETRPFVATDPSTGKYPNHNPFDPGTEYFRLWSIHAWQRYASPVWFDINQMDVLQYRSARSEQDERHICPLQLDVIERCVHLWSNPGDLVLDPFGGIGSTPVTVIKSGRKAVGIELKPSYWQCACSFLREAETDMNRPTLFPTEAMA